MIKETVNKNNVLIIILSILLVSGIANLIILNIRTGRLISESIKINEAVLQNAKKIQELEVNLESKIAAVEQKTNLTFDYVTTNQDTVNKQYKKTLEIERTYSGLLQEEKNRRVDSTELDLKINTTKKEAFTFFNKNAYSESLKKYIEVLAVNPSDHEARLYKMLSLFYINKMDSTKYKEILTDIKILKDNGEKDERINQVETFIKQELNQE